MQPSIFKKSILKALSITAVIGTLLAAPGTSQAETDLFNDIVYPGATQTKIYDVNNDGVAVGQGSGTPFYWDDDTFTGLSSLGGSFSMASDISNNGNWVVGYSKDSSTGANYHATLWNTATGSVTAIGDLDPYNTNLSSSYANAISDDGSIVTGRSQYFITSENRYLYEAFIYNVETEEMTGIGTLEGGDHSYAEDISADGSAVAGIAKNADGYIEAFIYDVNSETMTGLGSLDGLNSSYTTSISADGTKVVGYCINLNEAEYTAFMWTAEGNMEGLDSYFEDGGSAAIDVSGDGSSIVGISFDSEGDKFATLWIVGEDGIVVYNLWDLLEDEGADLSAWQSLTKARGISDDGNFIVGLGVDTDGNTASWIIDLSKSSISAVPVPGTFMLLVCGLVGLAGLRRRS